MHNPHSIIASHSRVLLRLFRCLILPLLVGAVPLRAQVSLPVEVFTYNTSAVSKSVEFIAPSGTASRLWLRIHLLDRQNKVAVKVNSGSFVDLSNATSGILFYGAASRYGGIGSAVHTVDLSLPLPLGGAGITASASNTLTFKINNTDGVSNGFRVLGFNLLNASGTKLMAASSFTQVDPAIWKAPSGFASQANIDLGQQLWTSATLKQSPLTGAPTLQAKCADCHAQDGRDLEYFAYSNDSIIARARFHGLSANDASRIASYIRSRSATLGISRYGRPWNPPYQPGPNTSTKPVAEWAAGAGIDWVLEKDEMTRDYIPGFGTSRDSFMSPSGPFFTGINLRDIPVAMQLPDWNHWLPRVHPKDAIGSTTFESHDIYTDYTKVRQGLSGQLNMTKEQYIRSQMRADLKQWGSDKTYSFTESEWAAATSTTIGTQAYADSRYGLATWSGVKLWEIMQEFGLEALQDSFYGVNATDNNGWFSNRHVFDISPHILGIVQNSTYPNITPVLGDYTGTDVVNTYVANQWYWLQILLNDGARDSTTGGFSTVDWNYVKGLFGTLKADSPTNASEPMRSTLFSLIAYDAHDTGYGPSDGTNPNPWWGWDLRDNAGVMARYPYDDWSQVTGKDGIVQNLNVMWLEKCAWFLPADWNKGYFDNFAGLNMVSPNYVVGTGYDPDNTVSRTATRSSGSKTLTAVNVSGLAVDMLVRGAGIPANTTITAVGSDTLTLSLAASSSGTSTLSFDVKLDKNRLIPEIIATKQIPALKGTLSRATPFTIHGAVINGVCSFAKMLWPNASNPWDSLRAPTAELAAPTGLARTNLGHRVTLTWNAVSGAQSYNIKRSTNSAGPFLTTRFFVAGTTYTDTALEPNITYYYKVSANSATAEGPDSAYISGLPTNGHIGWYQFDSSTGIDYDSSLSGNHGRAVGGPVLVPGKFAQAITLDGVDDFISVPRSFSDLLDKDATVTFWIKTTSTGVSSTSLLPTALMGVRATTTLGMGDYLGEDAFWGLLGSDGKIGARFKSGQSPVMSTVAVNTGSWVHVAITRAHSDGTVKVYINGTLNTTGTSGTGVVRRRFHSIGRTEDPNSRYFPATIDGLRLYDRILSDSEILSIAQ